MAGILWNKILDLSLNSEEGSEDGSVLQEIRQYQMDRRALLIQRPKKLRQSLRESDLKMSHGSLNFYRPGDQAASHLQSFVDGLFDRDESADGRSVPVNHHLQADEPEPWRTPGLGPAGFPPPYVLFPTDCM